MKQKFENIIVPPDEVKVQVAEWQSRNAPVLLEAGQESLFLELVDALVGATAAHIKKISAHHAYLCSPGSALAL